MRVARIERPKVTKVFPVLADGLIAGERGAAVATGASWVLMRVDLNGGNIVPSEIERSPGTGSGHRVDGAKAETGTADSRFSAGEGSVSSLATVALRAPEVRRGKVEALREQLSSGGYQVSSHQIAASIMEQLRVSHGSRPLKG